MPTQDGRKRVVITNVTPEVDEGRYPIKRVVGEKVTVEADIFADGHDLLSCLLLYRRDSEESWHKAAMEPLRNDRWRGEFRVVELGTTFYTLKAWINGFKTWRHDLQVRQEAGQDLTVPLFIGADLVEATAGGAAEFDAPRLRDWAMRLRAEKDQDLAYELALDEELRLLMERHPDEELAVRYCRELPVTVDRERARFGTWYEMFPRSCSPEPDRHGTFKDCEARLPYIAEMGFDVIYLPPVHPIGRSFRKGKNNTPTPDPDDVGSPWAIGSEEGGHKSVHPELGTLEDFRSFVKKAADHGIEIALDIAFQCSQDHPYVKDHPEWFRWRPDGTVQFAENPPKKYEDIYPFDFETEYWQTLWNELKSVVLFWIEQGVHILRVDNPHTKPFRFWEWLIREVKKEHPLTIFLSEAFTRPRVMHQLAKVGFTQSYTYFTWRNTKWDLTQYFTKLSQGKGREYFRPNLWPNTPDILNDYLQYGGRSAFVIRLVLAGTLGANYGIYGPAFELQENRALNPGSEEYLDSEKYQLRHWDLEQPESLKELIGLINKIRRENPALHNDWSLHFLEIDNEQIIAYSKHEEEGENSIVAVVNLDPYHVQSGWLDLSLEHFGINPAEPYQLHDLLTGARYISYGPRNYVQLDPQGAVAHLFRIRRRARTERDFDYYL
ncbi:MAG: alpha-1,4-glucan--maltose-1-phosphate maltosyltransferase [Deltaproteobacteria bacterium]